MDNIYNILIFYLFLYSYSGSQSTAYSTEFKVCERGFALSLNMSSELYNWVISWMLLGKDVIANITLLLNAP